MSLANLSRRATFVARLGCITPRFAVRRYAVPAGEYERKIYDLLSQSFEPQTLEVADVLGGCGSMFAIKVESSQFNNISMVKQHRLVNEVLKDEISKWHGLQLLTKGV